MKTCRTIAEIKGLCAVEDGEAVLLTERGRAGIFVFREGEYSSRLAIDTQNGVYVENTQNGCGAFERMGVEHLNPLWFGVELDGSDSSVGFEAFIDAMLGLNLAGILPAGKITLGTRVVRDIGDKNFKLRGQGAGLSVLVSPGLDITHTNLSGFEQITSPIQISDLSLHTTGQGATNALDLKVLPRIAAATMPGAYVDRVIIRGENVATDWFANGIVLTDEWNASVTNCFVKGKDDAYSPFDMVAGVALYRCNDCHVNHNHMYHMEKAVYAYSDLPSYGDGLEIFENRMVGVSFGVVSHTSGHAICMMGINDNHINAYIHGIYAEHLYYTPITGNLIFKTNLSTKHDWGGVILMASSGNRIIGNGIATPGAPAESHFGVYLIGSNDQLIAGNYFFSASPTFYGVVVCNGSAENFIIANKRDGSVAQMVLFSQAGAANGAIYNE
jgi:hypothetical protein